MTGEYAGTIPGLLDSAVRRDPDGVWLRSDAGSMTFSGAAIAAGLTASAMREAGLRRGDLVLVTASSTPHYLLCWLALAQAGAITVAVNPRGTSAELEGLIRQVQPAAMITDNDQRDLVRAAIEAAGGAAAPRLLDVASLVPDFWPDGPSLAAAGNAVTWPQALVAPDDVAVLIPTSGTTGKSKLVMQTHRAYAMAGEGFPYWMELTAADRLMTSLPLFHINAPAYSVMGSLACGAGLILLERFSASGFLDAARRHGATEFNAIGAMLEILMRQPERPDDADTPLRLCYTGPAPERDRQLEIERRFGLRLVVGYAMSESPYGLIWARGTRPYGTLGSVRQHPVLGTVNEARVQDQDGRELGPGESGELQLRNPVLTPGYWGMPEETARVLADGWLRTGDLVTVGADGTYTFVARVKEVIRRRGENLSPLEVEDVLAEHPDVLECAVVGVPSDLSEEEVKAFIVAAAGVEPDLAGLRAFAAERLAAFKVPRYWQVVGELPRTPTARVAKHRLPAGHPPGEYDAELVTTPNSSARQEGPAS
jgi:crotonobetaine/carnitine-CoA ligase